MFAQRLSHLLQHPSANPSVSISFRNQTTRFCSTNTNSTPVCEEVKVKRRKQRGKSKEARDERRQSEVRTGEGDEEVLKIVNSKLIGILQLKRDAFKQEIENTKSTIKELEKLRKTTFLTRLVDLEEIISDADVRILQAQFWSEELRTRPSKNPSESSSAIGQAGNTEGNVQSSRIERRGQHKISKSLIRLDEGARKIELLEISIQLARQLRTEEKQARDILIAFALMVLAFIGFIEFRSLKREMDEEEKERQAREATLRGQKNE